MKLYTRLVPRGLPQCALHDAAYALLFEALEADWQVSGVRVEKTALGQPYLAGENMPRISLSHTDGFVCCAVSEKPVGVDCERPRRVSEGAMRRVCTRAELADIHSAPDPAARFLQYWTLKESISKRRGVGLSESFRAYAVHFVNGEPRCAGYRMHFEMRDGYYLAAAE
ncbi:MAG: 4'-phosphopantetheinyl transferase family protein [Hominenteromicrobium sp.]